MALYKCNDGENQYLGFDAEDGVLTAQDVIVAMQTIINHWGSNAPVIFRTTDDAGKPNYHMAVSIFSTTESTNGEGSPVIAIADRPLLECKEE